MILVGSAIADGPPPQPRTADQITFAILTFLSVPVLQWLVWRFIVPAERGPLRGPTSFIPPPDSECRTGFFRGTFGFGYVMLTIYCIELAGFQIRSDWRGHIGFLVMGLVLIGLGMTVRLREAFAALRART